MIPLVIGAAAIAGGVATAAALSSSDDDKKNSETTSTRAVSDNYVEQKMARMGRPIKTAGDSQSSMRQNYSIFEMVKMIFAEQLDLEEDEFGWYSRIVEDLGANFNDRVVIFNRLEREFNVKLGGTNVKTVGDIVNLIDSK